MSARTSPKRSSSSNSRQSRIRGPSSRQKMSSARRSPWPSRTAPSAMRRSNRRSPAVEIAPRLGLHSSRHLGVEHRPHERFHGRGVLFPATADGGNGAGGRDRRRGRGARVERRDDARDLPHRVVRGTCRGGPGPHGPAPTAGGRRACDALPPGGHTPRRRHHVSRQRPNTRRGPSDGSVRPRVGTAVRVRPSSRGRGRGASPASSTCTRDRRGGTARTRGSPGRSRLRSAPGRQVGSADRSCARSQSGRERLGRFARGPDGRGLQRFDCVGTVEVDDCIELRREVARGNSGSDARFRVDRSRRWPARAEGSRAPVALRSRRWRSRTGASARRGAAPRSSRLGPAARAVARTCSPQSRAAVTVPS